MSTLALGCCSAISPCSHQQQWPDSICDICARSWDETRKRALDIDLKSAKRLLEANGHVVVPAQGTAEPAGWRVDRADDPTFPRFYRSKMRPLEPLLSGETRSEYLARVDTPMSRARALVEAHISDYGMVPHPDKLKEAIARELKGVAHCPVDLERQK